MKYAIYNVLFILTKIWAPSYSPQFLNQLLLMLLLLQFPPVGKA